MTDVEEPEDQAWHLYSRVGEFDSMQQGDLIRFENGHDLTKFGIVITADCDLDNRKHSGLVTLVPVVSEQALIVHCLGLDLLQYHREKLASFCKDQLKIDADPKDAAFVGHVKAAAKRVESSRELSLAIKALSQELDYVSIDALKALMDAMKVSSDKVLNRFQNQIVSRGDLMPLPAPPSITSAPRIAWLRRIWQEPLGTIAIRNSEEAERGGIRVARLESPYRYRLTQKVAQVFADIGLPTIELSDVNEGVHKVLTS